MKVKMQQIKDQRRRVVAVIIEVGIITLGVVGNSNLITSRPDRVGPRGMLNHI